MKLNRIEERSVSKIGSKVGEWQPQSGLNITDHTAFYEGSTPNITLIVMTNEVDRNETD